jgi:hypothetical protein
MAAPLGVLLLLLAWLVPGFVGAAPASFPAPAAAAAAPMDPGEALYAEAGLDGVLPREAFDAAYESMEQRGLRTGSLAIADMSQPSTAKRLYVIDLGTRQLVLRTFVAHGQGSGGLMAERFSNRHGSHQTSLGLYRVGGEITSPKHGAALLLQGLDAGVNDQARAREVIIHGADYASAEFVARNGRLGRSWGCPAVPRADMAQVIDVLADGGLLYVYGS